MFFSMLSVAVPEQDLDGVAAALEGPGDMGRTGFALREKLLDRLPKVNLKGVSGGCCHCFTGEGLVGWMNVESRECIQETWSIVDEISCPLWMSADDG